MSALLLIAGIVALPNIVADVNACVSAETAYDSSLATAQTWSQAYSQTQLQGFGAYVNMGTNDATALQAAGSTYVSACNKVITDLAALLSIPGVQAIYNVLVGLQISGTVSGANTTVNQEISAMVTVNSDISSMSSGASQSGILLPAGLASQASSVSTQGAVYLNSTAAAALAKVSSSIQATAQAAQSFASASEASVQGSIGSFAGAVSTISKASASMSAQTQDSVNAVSSASAYLGSATQARITEAANGRAQAASALSFFAGQNIDGGATAMAQAYVDLQAAATVGA
jgi:hypothetical protein